jgi:thiol-disulfide isomerase/thioredoxin
MRRNVFFAGVPGCFVIAAVLLGGMAGCAPPADGSGAGSGDETPQPEEKVTIRVVDKEGYEQAVAAHKGKIVLVDFWATWCEPCMKEFPRTVSLADKYADSGLVAVSVSMDELTEQEAALKFLQQQKAEFDNLITTYGVGAEQDTQFDFKGAGVPHYKLYDREGKLRYVFSEGLEPPHGEKSDQIEIRIKELLAEKGV